MILNEFEITGRARTHVLQNLNPRFAAQREVVDAFLAMRDAAAKDGIDMHPYSTFRDFETQKRIWNNKFLGKKPLFDIDGNIYTSAPKDSTELIKKILNWSALPGGSRHQWGPEIDVVDLSAVPTDYVPKLLPEEVYHGGVFCGLHHWLDENMAKFGFFRPYNTNKGGMFPEPWHLSYNPISKIIIKELTVEILRDALVGSGTLGSDAIEQLLPWIHENHILNITSFEDQIPISK
jgi:LAS superfamily LD-carboxypeptidase LdcB